MISPNLTQSSLPSESKTSDPNFYQISFNTSAQSASSLEISSASITANLKCLKKFEIVDLPLAIVPVKPTH